MIINCLVIGAGGGIGAILRYLISLLPIQQKSGFPFATLLTNVLGALLIGFITGLTLRGYKLDARFSLFLRVGVCGGFTTFSTFALETSGLLSEGKSFWGIVYMLLSIILSLLAVWIGEIIAQKI